MTWTTFSAIDTSQKSVTMTLNCPPDKSLTHRAVLFSSMARGTSQIHKPLTGEDCRATVQIMRDLGVQVETGDSWTVKSSGINTWAKTPTAVLDCGNSGTTARLLLGLLAGVDGFIGQMTGDESLCSRPMGRVTNLLAEAGAVFPQGCDRLPFEIHGKVLQPTRWHSDKASAQVKSALILAALQSQGEFSVSLPTGSRDHTELYLQKQGVPIRVRKQNGRETLTIQGPFELQPLETTIPGDPSSAAFLASLGLLLGKGQLKLLGVLNNPTRTGFFRQLAKMGVKWSDTDNHGSAWMEPVEDLSFDLEQSVQGADLQEQDVPSLVDEVPILAVVAAFAQGKSHFAGLDELRVKESDRFAATCRLLRAVGAEIEESGDNLTISGGLNSCDGFDFDPLGDHRLAMAAAVVGLTRATGPVRIKGFSCADVSFPGFEKMIADVKRDFGADH